MKRSIFRRATFLTLGIALSLAAALAADSTPGSGQNGLAGNPTPGGNPSKGDFQAVMIYRAAGPGARYCLTGDDDPLSSSGWGLYIFKACDPMKPSHWWLLGSQGELRPKNDPRMCMTWVSLDDDSERLKLESCEDQIGDDQIFKLRDTGRLTDQGGTWCVSFPYGAEIPMEGLCAGSQQLTETFRAAREPDVYFTMRAADDATWLLENQYWTWTKAPSAKMAQYWSAVRSNVVKDGKPTYFVVAGNDQTCLYATGWDGGTSTQACRVDDPNDTDLGSRWQFSQNADGSLVIRNAGNGQCADVSRGSGSRYGGLITWGCNGGKNQSFILEYSSRARSNVTMASLDQTSGEENCIVPDYGGRKVARSTCSKLRDVLRAGVNFRPDGAIEFRATGMCLDLYSWGSESGQYASNNGSNQSWTPRPIKVDVGSIAEDGAVPARFPLYESVGIESGADGGKFLQNRYASGNYDGHSVTAPLPPGETTASFTLRTASTEAVKGTATWMIADLRFADPCYNSGAADRVKRSDSRDDAVNDVLRLRTALQAFREHVNQLREEFPAVLAADESAGRNPINDLIRREAELFDLATRLAGPPSADEDINQIAAQLTRVWMYANDYYYDIRPHVTPLNLETSEAIDNILADVRILNHIVHDDLLAEAEWGQYSGLVCLAPETWRNYSGPAK